MKKQKKRQKKHRLNYRNQETEEKKEWIEQDWNKDTEVQKEHQTIKNRLKNEDLRHRTKARTDGIMLKKDTEQKKVKLNYVKIKNKDTEQKKDKVELC